MPVFRPLCSVLADFIGELPCPRPNESPTTTHENFAILPALEKQENKQA